MKPETQRVDAVLARHYLDAAPPHQRSIAKNHVAALASAMLNGEWQENGETIKFDKQGLLVDGQHRLHAIIMSDTVQTLLVVHGLDAATFVTIDVGRKRSPGDLFTIAGRKGGHMMAGLVRRIMEIEESHRRGYLIQVRPTYETMLQYHEDNEGEFEYAADLYRRLRFARLPNHTAAAITYLRRYAKDVAEDFADSLIAGSDLAPDSPVLHLRNRIMDAAAGANGNEAGHRRIAEVVSMFGLYVRGLKARRMAPTHLNDHGYQNFPILYVADGRAVLGDGRYVRASGAGSATSETRQANKPRVNRANGRAAAP